MFKTLQQLNTEIDGVFYANGAGSITGTNANAVLKSIASSTGNYFSIPKDASVTSADVGKLMMNDGSGTAKVYQYSSATSEQLGRWEIKITELTDTDSDTGFEIRTPENRVVFNRVDWRTNHADPPVAPADVYDELEWIQEFIDEHPALGNLTTALVSGELIVQEYAFQGTEIFVRNAPEDILMIDAVSVGALPAAPTAFPLGKLIGIEGSNALISAGTFETYTLDGEISMNADLFNMASDVDFETGDEMLSLLQYVAIPAPNGKVKAIETSDFEHDGPFTHVFRHFLIGVPVALTETTVTVMSLQQFSFVTNFFVRLANKGAFSHLLGTNLTQQEKLETLTLACSDETTALEPGTAKLTFRMPFAMRLTGVRASVATAATGVSLLTIDLNKNGSSFLTTKITIDAAEKTSKTAATQPVLAATMLDDDDEITVDIDQVGSTSAGTGLKVTLIGFRV